MNETYNPARERAKSVLVHYFRGIAEAANFRFDRDNSAEIEAALDDLIDAAIAECHSGRTE